MMNTHRKLFSFNMIFKCKLIRTHGVHIINLYFHVDFCEHNAHTILIDSMGLTQTIIYFAWVDQRAKVHMIHLKWKTIHIM